jgi:hypothetical protein
MKSFFQSVTCSSGKFCKSCRDQTRLGARWRASLLLVDPQLTENEFACPFGVAWGAGNQPARKVLVGAKDPRSVPSQPTHTLKEAATYAQAVLTGKKVTPEVQAQREAICAKCDMLKIPADGTPAFCGICKCQVSKESKQIRNLAAYEENLPKWGCKHPFRGWTGPQGQKPGWPVLNKSANG